MLGLLRPSELLTRDEGDDETGEVAHPTARLTVRESTWF
jgi:hypothetical protein